VTTFPKHPAMKAAATVADHGRQVTRAHARLDQVESTQSKQTSDITANAAATATNTTAIATTNTNVTTQTTNLTNLDSRLGGSTQETFLGSLNQAVAPSNPAHSGIGSIGHIGAAPTQSDFNNLVDDYNATNSCLNNLVDTVATMISRMDATNLWT